MTGTSEIKVTVVPATEQLAAALEVLAKHAKACAEELREMRLPPAGYLFSAEGAAG